MNIRVLLINILFCTGLFLSGNAIAQTPIELHITHKLAGKQFTLDTVAQNNLGNDFTITRLQYYISKISIKHDGGLVTKLPNHYVFVDAEQNVVDELGSLDITNVESISFSIGVDSVRNHADPSLYPSTHPLALRSPAMHWGWVSGYRFVAIEGMAGAGLSKAWGIHALGDQNYFETTVTVSGVTGAGRIVIPIQAEYTEAVKNIMVSTGLTLHGEDAEAVTLLTNFQTSVFSAGIPVGVNKVNQADVNVDVYPNPSVNNTVSVSFKNIPGKATVNVYDIQGRLVTSSAKAQNEKAVSLHISNSGIYTVKVQPENGNAIVRKIEIR